MRPSLYGWALTTGSCLGPRGMRTLEDGSVDVTITDPSYAEEAHVAQRRVVAGKGRGRKIRHRAVPFPPITAHELALAGRQIARVTRRWILVFCQPEQAHLWRAALEAGGAEYVRTLIWVKPDAKPCYQADAPGQGYESILLAHGARGKGERRRYNGNGRPGVYTFSKGVYRDGVNGQVEKLDVTEKPFELMRALVRDYSDPGELVLDPFAGAGATTGVAALREGRRFVGWEKRRAAAETARRRLAGDEARPDKRQPSLFTAMETT